MIIEKNRKAYRLSNNTKEKNLITLIETDNGWEKLAHGWEYVHWMVIGERGGLAEIGELKFHGRLKTSIEQYIQVYRHLFNKVYLLENLFNDFEVRGSISFTEEDPTNLKIVKETMIKDFEFTKASDSSFMKVITIQDSELLIRDNITFSFKPIQNLAVNKPYMPGDQLTLF
ncbi:hypothetical protein [Bacillus sp. FJAT-29937]|uniref:hypothetical protein n=1 Tax=Bacillus sp. FJAT-29937 TaxID=1720553 RepID=UPI000832E275|nr:hypothetical protein [Bacillus sp. FJAT-29937]